jgi:hypothetical protein
MRVRIIMLTTNSLRGHGGSSVVCCSPSRDISAARAPLLRKGGREEGGVGGREREIERERESARARERERTERERRESEKERRREREREGERGREKRKRERQKDPVFR